MPENKKTRSTFALRVFGISSSTLLLDLGFLVDHVLANNRIVFLEFELVRGVALVIVGSVEVTGTGRGYQTDLLACSFSHVSDLLRLSRHGHAVQPEPHQCPSCR